MNTWTVTVDSGGERLDRYLAAMRADLSRSRLQQLIRSGDVLVNGSTEKASYVPQPGDVIVVRLPDEAHQAPIAEQIPLRVVYEDDALLVIDKAPGIVVHPSAGHPSGTLVNALLAHRPDVARADADPSRPGIVHRLDRDTSGLLVVAARRDVQDALMKQFKARRVTKVYLALLHGALAPSRGLVDAPVGRDPNLRQRMAVLSQGGRAAKTQYHVREYLEGYTYVEASLLTGRTHQLRVHFAALGHPIVGDRTYGHRREHLGVPRQFLHAWRLVFEHPVTGKEVEFTSDLPEDLAGPLARLREDASRHS